MSSYLVIMKFLVALPSLILTPLSILISAIKESSLLVLATLSELPAVIKEEIVEEVIDYYKIDAPVKDAILPDEELKEQEIYGYSA